MDNDKVIIMIVTRIFGLTFAVVRSIAVKTPFYEITQPGHPSAGRQNEYWR